LGTRVRDTNGFGEYLLNGSRNSLYSNMLRNPQPSHPPIAIDAPKLEYPHKHDYFTVPPKQLLTKISHDDKVLCSTK
jgi:hypothetical protein